MRKKKIYADFTEAFFVFLQMNCVAATDGEIGSNQLPYIGCEIRIVLNPFGGGYIHLLGQDSHTVDFATMDHYKSTGTPKPKHLL